MQERGHMACTCKVAGNLRQSGAAGSHPLPNHMNILIFLQRNLRGVSLAIVAIAASIQVTEAQSSLFNVPTADVMEEGSAYVEADFDAHFAKYRDGGWQSYGVSAIYGIRKKTEIGLNAYLVRSADGLSPVEIQPNIKYRLYTNESLGVSVATGAIAYIPVSRRFGRDAMASAYVVAGKKFKSEWSPRFSAGAYQLIGTKTGSGSTRGALLGVEQPVHRRVVLIADWNTGKNRFGYSAAGVGITLTKKSYLYSAYYFGNEGRGNNSLGVYYGYSF